MSYASRKVIFPGELGPRLALESVAEVLAALVGLPLCLGC
jgi:hypothetical protein